MGALVTAALVAALSASTPAPAQAGAQQPCWRGVVTDWSNGGIDRRHSLRCYRSALHNLPNDIRTYTTAEDDIRRALLEEIRDRRPMRGTDAALRSTARPDAAAPSTTPTRSLQSRSRATRAAAATPAAGSPPLRAVLAAGLALLLLLVAAVGKYLAQRRASRAAA